MRRWIGSLLILGVLLLPVWGFAATATLSWTDNSTNEDGFHIQRKVEDCLGTGAFTELAHVLKDLVQYVDASVQEGNKYCYRVNAYNTAGESAWSNSAGVGFPYTIASTPTNLTVSTAGVLTWVEKTNNESGFIVERKPTACANTGTFAAVTTTGPNIVTYTDNVGIIEGATYCYRVAVTNALGTSPYSNTVERVVPLTVPAAPGQLGVVAGP